MWCVLPKVLVLIAVTLAIAAMTAGVQTFTDMSSLPVLLGL